MPRSRPPIRFDDLPLFASDADLATAVVGTDPEKRAMWLAQLPILEMDGFPKKVSGWGRYRPAVRAYYDRCYITGGAGGSWPATPVIEQEGEWNPRRGRPRRKV